MGRSLAVEGLKKTQFTHKTEETQEYEWSLAAIFDFSGPGDLEDMDKDWFKTFVMGRNIHKAWLCALCGYELYKWIWVTVPVGKIVFHDTLQPKNGLAFVAPTDGTRQC